jgi:N-acetylmuramoyl-L-alanine amidase
MSISSISNKGALTIWKPLPYGGGMNRPGTIVVHCMAENIKGWGSAWDLLNKQGLSAHALIWPSGTIMRCRDDELVAWHAKGYNQDSLGVEFLVPGDYDYGSFVERIKTPYLTPKQFDAGVYLLRDWLQQYPDCEIVRHSDIDPQRKVDPGAGFPWQKLLDEVMK